MAAMYNKKGLKFLLLRIIPGKLSRILHLGSTVGIIYNILGLHDKEFAKSKI